jgi:tetratricopeptide (TPR) repeat protein
MRSLKIYSGILATVLLVFFGVIYWPAFEKYHDERGQSIQKDQQDIADLQLAEMHFKKGQYDEALELIIRHQDLLGSKSEPGQEWVDLLVKISEKTFDVPQLVLINEYYPESLANNEKASLLVAESLIMGEQNKAYETLRQKWAGRERYKETWSLLDADHLLVQGKHKEGSELLEVPLKGKDEAARLIRLGLLNAMENPEKGLKYLSEARAKDPTDLDAILYQTKLAEKLGRNDLVLENYKQAILDNPGSVFLKDQLAEFYARHEQYPLAIKTWEEALVLPSKDQEFFQKEAFVKLNFFTRMTNGEDKPKPTHLTLNSLMSYLVHLNKGEFFDETAFSRLPLKNDYLEKSQVIYWLTLLDALKKGDKDKAFNLLLTTPFKAVSFNPDLEFAILQVLHFQKTGELLSADQNRQQSDHPLLKALSSQEPLPHDIQALLLSPEAFSSLLLAHNWTEGALLLHQMDTLPEHFPKWLSLELTEAIRTHRGEKAALAFISKQQIHDSDLALITQEMTARSALSDGNTELAEMIYESLLERSYEAKSYIARKAFMERNYPLAQKLTEELIEKYPDNALLRENLRKIQQKNS